MHLQYEDFEKIMDIGVRLSTERDRNRLLMTILDKGMEITNCDASTLYLYEKDELHFKFMKTLSQGISRGLAGEVIDLPPVPMKEENVCSYAAIHREVVNIPDVYASSRFDFSGPRQYDSLTGYCTQSQLVVPLANNENELIGVLQLINAMDEDGSVTAFNEEYEIMKTHAMLSYEIIKERWDISSQVKTAVLYHHENVDGSGYPEGIDGDSMTIFTKILHVADVYDALVSRRPYKSPYPPYEACEYLMGAGGIMFDPKVVETLLRYVPLYPKGTQVELSDGRQAIIVENAGNRNLRPLIRVLDGTMIDLLNPSYYNLTILRSANEEIVDPCAEEEERRKMLTPSKKYRIMLIDDVLVNLQTIRGFLQNAYELSLLTSVRQALLYLKRQTEPDLIILDMDMPEMSGIDAAAK